MSKGSESPSPALPWLAELVPAGAPAILVREGGKTPALGLAMATRRLGARRELARALGRGEALGVDLVHAASNALLASGALPQAAALHIVAPRDADLPIAITAGIARACSAKGVPLVVPVAAHAEAPEQIGLVLTGGVIATPVEAREAGDVVLALRGNGPNDADLETLLARAHQLRLGLDDRLANGDTVGVTLVAPQKSQFSVLQQPLRERWPVLLLAVDDQPLAQTLRAALPSGLAVEWDFDAWRPPAPFGEWFAGREGSARAAETTSFGCSMLVVVAEAGAARWLQLCAAWNEPAIRIARLVAAAEPGGEVAAG